MGSGLCLEYLCLFCQQATMSRATSRFLSNQIRDFGLKWLKIQIALVLLGYLAAAAESVSSYCLYQRGQRHHFPLAQAHNISSPSEQKNP